jgi:hypothetical protein
MAIWMVLVTLWIIVLACAFGVFLLVQINHNLSFLCVRVSYFEKKIQDEDIISGQLGFLVKSLTPVLSNAVRNLRD